jgi:hypothetical protein
MSAPTPKPYANQAEFHGALAEYRSGGQGLLQLSRLASSLGGFADQVEPDEGEEILLHAMAMEAGEDGRLAEDLGRFTSPAESRWSPSSDAGPLQWSVRTVIDAPDLVTPESPRVMAWFLEDSDERIQEVVILGQGTGLLRRRLEEIGLRTALTLPRDGHALALDGVIWIAADALGDGQPGGWAAEDQEIAADALTLLRIELQEFETHSALVKVLRVPFEEKVELVGPSLQALEREAGSRPQRLRGPMGTDSIAALLPARKSGGRLPLSVPFPIGLLEAPSFRRLYQRTSGRMLETVLSDASPSIATTRSTTRPSSATISPFRRPSVRLSTTRRFK